MKRLAVIALSLVLLAAIPAQAGTGNTKVWRNTSYNSALSLHQAAVPLQGYPVGTKIRLTVGGRSLWVRSISGGCQCRDISDEAFRYLMGSTSMGLIPRLTATKIGG